MPGGFLDDYIIHVKPDKRTDFDVIGKKMAEANRKAKGDTFIAAEQVYGPDFTVMFISTRANYAAIDNGARAFMAAMNEAYGPGGMKKFMADSAATVASAAGRLRVRRIDLSSNFPADASAYYELVGKTRYLRVTEYHVRSGHGAQFEKLGMQVNEAFQKSGAKFASSVSQSVAGAPAGIYYITSLVPDMAALDSIPTVGSLRSAVGDDEYGRWYKELGECVDSYETFIYRFNPEWSNPPKEVADADPGFWRPKVVSMAKPKPKPTETKAGTTN